MQRSTDLRFLKKILTDTEMTQVRGCEDPDALLWSIWACKEAAYKVLKKRAGDAAFIPRRWSVCFRPPLPVAGGQGIKQTDSFPEDRTPAGFFTGNVITDEKNIFPFRLFSSPSWIHSLAADSFEILHKAAWRIETLPDEQSQQKVDPSSFGRSCLIRDLSEFLRVDQHQIEIRRPSQCESELQPPAVYLQGVRAAGVDISLSHDGRFVSYAFVPLS